MNAEREHDRLRSALLRARGVVGGTRPLGQSHGKLAWPARGVYFFVEPTGEVADESLGRIVRVGTHGLSRGSRATLWNRLSQHRGTRSGAGSHRGSIFRLLVGEAMLRRDGLDYGPWSTGSGVTAAAKKLGIEPDELKLTEEPWEREVSRYLGSVEVIVVEFDDPSGPSSGRGQIERAAIAFLSSPAGRELNGPEDGWLGLHSPRSKVRDSGLWNQDHVGAISEHGDFDQLERAVASMEGR